MLIEFHGKEPDQITEEELKAYFLHRKNVDHWAPNTLRIAYCAIKFFYLHKVRYYGFLHPGCSMPLEEIAAMIRQACEMTIPDADAMETISAARTTPVCPVCGGAMVCKAVILPCMMAPIGYG